MATTKKNNPNTPDKSAIEFNKSKVADKPAFSLSDAEKLPVHFDHYEEALEARNELKAKVAASKQLLMTAESILVGILDDTPFLLFAQPVPKRFEKEHEWYELVNVNGKSFGFIDSEDKTVEETLMVTVQRSDGEAMRMPIVKLAFPTTRKLPDKFISTFGCVAEVLKYWYASGADAKDDFERLVAQPMLRDEELLRLLEKYLEEFAKSRLKMLK